MTIEPGRWSRTFTDAVEAGELRLPFDPATGRPVSLHDRRLDGLGDTSAEWRPARGTGVVVSHVRFHRRYATTAGEPPILALIELDEGHRLVAPLIEIEPDRLAVGLAVEVADRPPQGPLAFRPRHDQR